MPEDLPQQRNTDVTLVGIGDPHLALALHHELMSGAGERAFEPMITQQPDEFAPLERPRHATDRERGDAFPAPEGEHRRNEA